MKLIRPKEKRYVIVDVDPGCDDAWALLILLKAMASDLCEILAITCVSGNTDVDCGVKNALRVLKTVGNEKDIPVYRGASKGLVQTEIIEKFHGEDGLQDIFPDDVDVSLVPKNHAVTAIYDLVKKKPNQVSLICLGPLTNIALALRMYDDFAQNVKDIFIMGGNFKAVRTAEYNFYCDSEAANIVLEAMPCPITILPWEACITTNTVEWRKEVLGKLDNAITKLLNPVEYKAYANCSVYYNCDAHLAAAFISKDMIKTANDWHATVELHGLHTRGQLVLDHMKKYPDNAYVIEEIHVEILKLIQLWACGHDTEIEIV